MATSFKVPIRNLFCLLSYVNEMPELIHSMSDVDEDLITYDFIAKQFLQEVNRLFRRGLIKDYVEKQEATSQLGGRVMMNESLHYLVSKQPILVCVKDEYTTNILLNQIMKSTLQAIASNYYIKEETRRQSFMHQELLPEVDIVPLSKEMFHRIYLTRHNLHYRRMIHIARLLHEFTLLTHKSGDWSLFTAEVDDQSLNQIFEKFLFHFYRIEQKDYRVSSEGLRWNLEGNQEFLPSMRTDVSLENRNSLEKIVIDAKFYKHIFQENYGKSSFHSHNMYQLFTYLMHQPKEMNVRGILIYPYNGVEVDESYRWDDRMTIEIMTLNLDDSWKNIYVKLLGVLNR